jgi:hypothetical protein
VRLKDIKKTLRDNWRLDTPDVLDQLKKELSFSPIQTVKKGFRIQWKYSLVFSSLIICFVFGTLWLSLNGLPESRKSDEITNGDHGIVDQDPKGNDDGGLDDRFSSDRLVKYQIDGNDVSLAEAKNDEVIELIQNLPVKSTTKDSFLMESNSAGQKYEKVRLYLEFTDRNLQIINIKEKYFLIKTENANREYFEITDDTKLVKFLTEKTKNNSNNGSDFDSGNNAGNNP